MRVAKIVHFRGRVQGVGFRYTARRVAQEFEVGGFVRNLADGRVEMQAEGRVDEVERFIAAVCEEMADFIEGHTIQDATVTDASEFTIR